ncbi:MAG: hypothetical protein SFV54_23000 [Bryobacteraceae bacterium]|nr:hypothetical protein [Bryobacteraceae bacterium]
MLVASVAAGQSGPPSTTEVAKAFESKVFEHGSRILYWEKRFAVFTIRDIREWDIRFRHLKNEKTASLLKQRYSAIAQKAGVCKAYSVVQVVPFGPPPQHVKRDTQVHDLGVVACK